MNDRQNAKLNMAQRVSETYTRYENLYNQVPALISAVETLNEDIDNIREVLKERGEVNVSAATLEKRVAEKNMIGLCIKATNALSVIGFLNSNPDLTTFQSTSENTFYRLSHNATLALAKRVLNKAREHEVELRDFGFHPDEANEMENAINKFQLIIAKPMDRIGERKQKTTNLAQLFAALDSTFYDRLDKLMILFKESEPDFYGEYRTARNIIFPNERKYKKAKANTED